MAPRPRRPFLWVALLLCLAIGALPAVSGHALYGESSPAAGERLDASPSVVWVLLTEDADPSGSSLVVADANGSQVDNGDARFEARGQQTLITVTVDELPPGIYTGTWTALSSVDGHITRGSWGFAIGAFEPPIIEPEPEAWAGVSAAARFLLYTGFAGVAGTLLFLWGFERDTARITPRRTLERIAIVAASTQVLAIVILTTDTWMQSGLGLRTFLRETAVGLGLTLRFVLALVLAVTLARRFRPHRPAPDARTEQRMRLAVGVGFLLAALGSARFGHASEAGALGIALDWLHVVAASIWVGGLGVLLLEVGASIRAREGQHLRRIGLRFAEVALYASVAVVVTGILTSLVILGRDVLTTPSLLWSGRYERFLFAKMLLLLAMLGLAAANRFLFLGTRTIHTPASERSADRVQDEVPPEGQLIGIRDASGFRRSLGAETTLAVVVLVCAGFLTALSPSAFVPADLGESPEFRLSAEGSDFNVTMMLASPPIAQRAGNLSLLIWNTETFEPLNDAIRVLVDVSVDDEPDAGAIRYRGSPVGNGTWEVGEVLFARSGNHTMVVSIQTPFVYRDEVTLRFVVADPNGTPPA